jgi:integrase
MDDDLIIHGKLTSAAVRNTRKPGLYGDGHGLALQISKFDTKAWVLRYMIDGRARKMGLGPLHTVSLAKARKDAAKIRLKIREGIDPIDERDAELAKRKVEAAKAITFKQCAERYIDANLAKWKNPKHGAQWAATFAETKRWKRTFPAATALINDMPVAAIDVALVLRVLEPIWTKTPETASRVRGRIESVLDWATVLKYRAGDNPARWSGNLKQVLPARAAVQAVQHHAALHYVELPAFMAALRDKQGTAARALEFTVLTAARTGEALGARWSEVDLTARLWTIPGERMKADKEHRVPLSDRAVEILNTLPREGDFVFAGARANRPLSNDAMLQVVRAIRPGFTSHGFRSTFRDWASEQTAYPNELCELALAHAVGNKVEAAYRRGDMMDKRRRLMSDWADFCAPPKADGDNVLPMRRAAK